MAVAAGEANTAGETSGSAVHAPIHSLEAGQRQLRRETGQQLIQGCFSLFLQEGSARVTSYSSEKGRKQGFGIRLQMMTGERPTQPPNQSDGCTRYLKRIDNEIIIKDLFYFTGSTKCTF